MFFSQKKGLQKIFLQYLWDRQTETELQTALWMFDLLKRDKFWLLLLVQTQLVRGITIYHTEGEVIVSDLDVRSQNHFTSNQTPQII